MITIEQARKFISEQENLKLSDEDVKQVLSDMRLFANLAVDKYLEGNSGCILHKQ